MREDTRGQETMNVTYARKLLSRNIKWCATGQFALPHKLNTIACYRSKLLKHCRHLYLLYIIVHFRQGHLKPEDRDTKLICKYCGKGFTNANYVRQHENTHTGTKPFICDVSTRRLKYLKVYSSL